MTQGYGEDNGQQGQWGQDGQNPPLAPQPPQQPQWGSPEQAPSAQPQWGQASPAAAPGAYPRANTPQLWNATAFPLLVQTLLGLVPLLSGSA